MRYSRRHLAWIAPAAIVLGATAWAGFAPVDSDSREHVFVIPQGTWARRNAGEKLEVLPSEIRLTLGVKDILVMRNQDDVPQMFGPVLIMPGQSFRLPFSVVSSNQFACTAHVSGTLTVIVEPKPAPGWERFRWRASTIMQRNG
jgi:hypothetical protein